MSLKFDSEYVVIYQVPDDHKAIGFGVNDVGVLGYRLFGFDLLLGLAFSFLYFALHV